jgi:hypothetical protein
MIRGESLTLATTTGFFILWLTSLSSLGWAATPQGDHTPSGTAPASLPTDEVVDKYLDGCLSKSKATSCDKLRKDFVEILKEDLMTLGSTAKRDYLPLIVQMFHSDETVLRIAAADAIGMIGPEDSDVEMLAPLTNDEVPDVRQAVSNMLSHGKGTAIALLKQRMMPMRTGRTPENPADPTKLGMPVAPDSVYLFDASDASVGRLSYVSKGKSDPGQFYKGKAKKGPFPLQEFKDKYRYQFQDEDEAMNQAREAEGKELENSQPPDPSNLEAYTAFMQKLASVGAKQGGRIYLDSYEPKLFDSPTVYVLEERQIGKRNYPTRYVVAYQELAFKRPGFRLAWMTVSDDDIKTAQAASLEHEKEWMANQAEREAVKKRQAELDSLTKKKDAAEKKQFKKGQADLEKELGF